MNYADRNRQVRAGVAPQPRNVRAAQIAIERDEALFVSFVGDTEWSNPTVYCDSGKRYDWGFLAGQEVVVVVKAGTDPKDALSRILERSDTIRVGYPILLDIEMQELSCVVHGTPVDLWQTRRGSELWQQYFAPQP